MQKKEFRLKMIPVSKPIFCGNEAKYMADCIQSGWISSSGPYVEKFEAAFATRMGRKHAVAVSSGTAALQVAMDSLQLSKHYSQAVRGHKNDLNNFEVIMPTFTIISCALAVIRAGCKPVFVDSDSRTFNMDVSQIESKITNKTKAIMAVHIYGLPCEMNPILTLAEQYDLKVIEDFSQAIGQTYNDRSCGSFGDISICSFYANKAITTGEGGAILTDDQELAARCRSLRNLCFKPQHNFVHEKLGYNFRMTNMQAAVGLAQLERLALTLQTKRQIGEVYQKLLCDVPGLQLPIDETKYAENCYWCFPIVSRANYSKWLIRSLSWKEIQARHFFKPLHQQPCLKMSGIFPVAERLYEEGLYLPSGPNIDIEEIKTVATTLKKLL